MVSISLVWLVLIWLFGAVFGAVITKLALYLFAR